MTRVNNQWTPANNASFKAMWESGATLDQIKERFKIGQASVERRRFDLRLMPRSMDRGFSDSDIETIRTLWMQGKSAAEIAAILPGNRTRNSVIGKCHRLGLTRASRPASAPPLRVGKAAKPRKFKAPKPLPADRKPRERAPVAAADRSWQTPVSTPGIQRAQRSYGQSAVAFVESGAGVESPNARPFLEATRGCKWPIGQGATLSYCCNPLAGGDGVGRTYCAGHVAVAVDAKPSRNLRPGSAVHLARFDRIEPARPVAANSNGSIWDQGRAA